ncbi:MAG: DUF5305 family protein [Halodesulfurarchaeum sp.]
MMDDRTRLRLRSTLDSWIWVVVAVLLLAVVLGMWGTYAAHVDPGTEEEVQTVEVWSIEGTFEHRAQVVEENPVFENGTTLVNRSAYFSQLSPVFEGNYSLTYQSGTETQATVTLQPSLVIEARDENTVYWRNVTTLDSTVTTLEPGESTALDLAVNTTAVDQRETAIVEAVGNPPGETTTSVVVDVVAEAPVEDADSRLAYTARMPVSTEGDVYRIEAPSENGETATTQNVIERTASAGPLLGTGGPVVLLLSLAAVLAVIVGYRRDWYSMTSAERDRLAFLTERNEFEEWIVRARVPDAVDDREPTRAERLTDVVDFAIDSGVSVIEDPDRRRYYAITAEQVLIYDPPVGVPIAPGQPGEGGK